MACQKMLTHFILIYLTVQIYNNGKKKRKIKVLIVTYIPPEHFISPLNFLKGLLH